MEAFYPVKRPKTRNRWPSKENAPKIIFFAEMGFIYTGPNYIKRQSGSDNFFDILVHPTVDEVTAKCVENRSQGDQVKITQVLLFDV